MVQILDKSEIARNGNWSVGNCVLAVCHSILLHHHTSATVTGDHSYILPHLFPEGDHLTLPPFDNLFYKPPPFTFPYQPLAGEHSYIIALLSPQVIILPLPSPYLSLLFIF